MLSSNESDPGIAERAVGTLLLPAIVGGALFMQTLDATIITTALPSMAHSLRESPVHLNLAISAYLLSAAMFIPISGWMADRFGARQVFRVAVALFVISSILCGLSQSLLQLIAARACQGIAGAMMVPVGRVLVLASVPKDVMVQAMSTMTTPAILGPLLGPPLGGLIVTYFPWNMIFFLNIPVGIIGFILITIYVKEIPKNSSLPLDLSGFCLSGLSMAGLVLGLELLGRGIVGFPIVCCLILFGILFGGLYVRNAQRTDHPILDLSLLRISTFFTATFGGGLCRISLGAMPFLLAILLQIGFGLTPLTAGLITLASVVGALANKAIIRPATRLFGFRSLLIYTCLLHSMLLLAFGLFQKSTAHALIIAALLVGGFIRSLLFTSLNTFTYADVAQDRISNSSALTSVATQLSMSIGVSIAALVLGLSVTLRGGDMLVANDVSVAFFAIGLISLLALPLFLRLPPSAGTEMSGHRA